MQNFTAFKRGGDHYVVAGKRRLSAVLELIKQKELQADYSLQVNLVDEGDSTDVSLTENFVRAKMPPYDQFVAFNKLVNLSKSRTGIAAEYGVSVSYVEQRMALASVHVKILKAYKNGDLDKSGAKRLSNQINSRLRLASRSNLRLD